MPSAAARCPAVAVGASATRWSVSRAWALCPSPIWTVPKSRRDVVAVGTDRYGNGLDPPDDRRHLAAFEDLLPLREDHVEGRLPIARSQQVLDGRSDVAAVQVPACSRPQQRRLGGGVLAPQAPPQQFSEEMVETEPFSAGIELHHEHRLALEFVDEVLGTYYPGQFRHQFGGELVKDRSTEQETANVLRLGIEHLAAQVVGHYPIVSAELGDGGVWVFFQLQQDCRQLQPGGPALGPVHEGGDAVTAEVLPRDPLEELGRVGLVECKIRLTQLEDVELHAVTTPGDPHVGPGRHDHVGVRREQLDQLGHVAQQGDIGQAVQIVEDNDHLGELAELRTQCLKETAAKSPPATATSGPRSTTSGLTGASPARSFRAKRTGSSSVGSRATHTDATSGCVPSHWLRSTDLPEPAGATISDRVRSSEESRRRRRSGRSTA